MWAEERPCCWRSPQVPRNESDPRLLLYGKNKNRLSERETVRRGPPPLAAAVSAESGRCQRALLSVLKSQLPCRCRAAWTDFCGRFGKYYPLRLRKESNFLAGA